MKTLVKIKPYIIIIVIVHLSFMYMFNTINMLDTKSEIKILEILTILSVSIPYFEYKRKGTKYVPKPIYTYSTFKAIKKQQIIDYKEYLEEYNKNIPLEEYYIEASVELHAIRLYKKYLLYNGLDIKHSCAYNKITSDLNNIQSGQYGFKKLDFLKNIDNIMDNEFNQIIMSKVV